IYVGDRPYNNSKPVRTDEIENKSRILFCDQISGSVQRGLARKLARDLRNKFPGHVGEPHVATVESVGKALMIQAQLMQDRRMDVVVGEHLFRGLVAELIRGADGLAAWHAAAGHP